MRSLVKALIDDFLWWKPFTPIRIFVETVQRLWGWFPVIVRDRDFDYAFFLEIVRYKLSRMRKCILANDIVMAAPRIGRQIAYAEYLLELIEKTPDHDPRIDEYYERLFKHMKKYVRHWWD